MQQAYASPLPQPTTAHAPRQATATCPPHCPGRRSHWHAWMHESLSCPLGAPCCPAWNAELVVVRGGDSAIRKVDAA